MHYRIHTDLTPSAAAGRWLMSCLRAMIAAVAAGLAIGPAWAGTVRVENAFSDCPMSYTTQFDERQGAQQASIHVSTGGCNIDALAVQGPGVLAAKASIQVYTGSWWSEYARVTSSASFSEKIQVTASNSIDPSVGLDGITYVLVMGRVSAHGTAVAPPAGQFGGASAGFSFNTSFLGSGGVRSGTYVVVGGEVSAQGELGVLAGEPTLIALGETYDLSMSAAATATLSKCFCPGRVFDGMADADFSHTLLWQGMQLLGAFDADRDPVDVPEGVSFSFVGATSGFDYAHAAVNPFAPPRPPGQVPLPATGWLCLLALGLLARPAHRAVGFHRSG